MATFEQVMNAAFDYAESGFVSNLVSTFENFNDTGITEILFNRSYTGYNGPTDEILYRNLNSGILTERRIEAGGDFIKFGGNDIQVHGVNTMYMSPPAMYEEYTLFNL